MPSCMTNPSLLPQVCSPTTGVLSFGTFPRALVRNLLRTAGHGLKRSELTEIRKDSVITRDLHEWRRTR